MIGYILLGGISLAGAILYVSANSRNRDAAWEKAHPKLEKPKGDGVVHVNPAATATPVPTQTQETIKLEIQKLNETLLQLKKEVPPSMYKFSYDITLSSFKYKEYLNYPGFQLSPETKP